MSAKPWESGRNFASQVRNPGSAVIGKSAPARNQGRDRKSTRLNSSHSQISYAVFCLKKKNNSYNRYSRQKYHLPLSIPQWNYITSKDHSHTVMSLGEMMHNLHYTYICDTYYSPAVI